MCTKYIIKPHVIKKQPWESTLHVDPQAVMILYHRIELVLPVINVGEASCLSCVDDDDSSVFYSFMKQKFPVIVTLNL